MGSAFIGIKSNKGKKLFMIYEGVEDVKKYFEEGEKFTGRQLIQKAKVVLDGYRTVLYGQQYFFKNGFLKEIEDIFRNIDIMQTNTTQTNTHHESLMEKIRENEKYEITSVS